MKTKIQKILLLLLFLSSLSASAITAKTQTLIAAGSPMSDSIHFQYALYYLPTAKKNPLKVLKRLLRTKAPGFKLVDSIPEIPDKLFVQAILEDNALEKYRAPDLDTLKNSGRGLSKEQAASLQGAQQVLILNFAYPKKQVWSGLRAANLLLKELARKTNALLWDELTREIFTLKAWQNRRLAKWTNAVPDISKHITIHAYKSGDFIRAITLGMAKFGLPDVVVDNFVWSSNRTVGHLINLFSQAMAEGAEFSKVGSYELNIHSIKHPDVRKPQLESLKKNAKAEATLTLRKGIWEQGDPRNRLVQIMFDHYPGRDVHAKLDAMMTSLFGSEDAVKYINHNDALKAESEKAKAKLAGLKQKFNAGLKPGEFIQVKAPFAVPSGGNEWMWVEISKWQGSIIEGLLKNEPFNIPQLHAGQIVKINQPEVFDYIHTYPDGRREGNKTAEIIKKMRNLK